MDMDFRGYGLPIHPSLYTCNYSRDPPITRILPEEAAAPELRHPRGRYGGYHKRSTISYPLPINYENPFSPPLNPPYPQPSSSSASGSPSSKAKVTLPSDDMYWKKSSSSRTTTKSSTRVEHHRQQQQATKPKSPYPPSPPLSKRRVTCKENKNCSIDVDLRNLNHELSAAHRTYLCFQTNFQTQITPLQDWADNVTLDTIWRDKISKTGSKQKFEGVLTKIQNCRFSLKESLVMAKCGLAQKVGDMYALERQIRTGRKVLLYCDGIIQLAERALTERLACKQLVLEIEEVTGLLLDPIRNAWIYGCEEETGMSEMELCNPVDGGAPGKCERSQKVDTSEDIGSDG